MIFASIADEVSFGGMDECPLLPFAVIFILVEPFSAIPITARGQVNPSITSLITQPPSSMTKSNCNFLSWNNSDIFLAPFCPPTSSSNPKAK